MNFLAIKLRLEHKLDKRLKRL